MASFLLRRHLFSAELWTPRQVDAMSSEGERRHIANLICGFIAKIDFKRDLEQQLNIFVDCRAAFPNMELVKDRYVTLRVQIKNRKEE